MDPYEALGVAKDAPPDEIKRVYRRLARETHPDLNPGDAAAEARFKEISTAYDVLCDEEKRRAFDEFGEVSLEAGFDADRARAERERFEARFGSPDDGGFGEGFAFGGLDDLLRGFSGQGGFREGGMRFARAGPDIEAAMSLGFVEAVRGGEKRLSVGRPRADGSLLPEDITVRIPSGVTDGGRLRIPGKGGEGVDGGPPGDLWIRVRVEPHPVFRIDGRDLEFDLPIRVSEAICGARVEVPTLGGRATLAIPPGTSSHTRLRLRGQGVPASGSQAPGDLYARVKIVVPKDVDPEVRASIDRLEQDDPRKGLFQ